MATAYAAEAIVLRSFRTGEADRVVHLLTPDRGRVNVIAKGARRTTAKIGARLEPMTRIEAMIQPGKGDLATITGAHVLWTGDDLRRDPVRVLAATGGIEAVVRLFPEPEPDVRLFEGLARYLEAMTEPLGDDVRAGADALTLAFVLKLLALAGWRPEVAACVGCGGAVEVYDAAAGCAYCATCGSGVPLDQASATAAARLISEPLGAVPALSSEQRAAIARVCRATAQEHGGVRLALLATA
ncbi:MAG: DNA repair protein RecO [Gaiellales bacterium]